MGQLGAVACCQQGSLRGSQLVGTGTGTEQGQPGQQLCRGRPGGLWVYPVNPRVYWGLVYQDGGAIPPACSASRGSSTERKADVTPCFWVQTIGIQERGAAQLRELACPSSACPATLPSAPAPPRSPALWGAPGPGRRPGCTLTSPGVSPAGGHGVGGVALPTRGGSAPPQHPWVPWGCRQPRTIEQGSASGVSWLPSHQGWGELGGPAGGPVGRLAPTCRSPVSFPAGTAGAGCLLAHPTCHCTPAGSMQEPRESGARGCGQARTCAPLPTAQPSRRAKPPPRAGVGGRGVPGGWDGGYGAGRVE